MKRYLNLGFVLVLALALFVACDNPTESEESSYEVMTEYMTNNNLDLNDMLSGWITDAQDVNVNKDDYFLMDIRKPEHYNQGHIEGAVNTSLGDVLETAEQSAGKPIVVICYSGQSAAHAVTALRLSGYSDAKSLKFGMSSWHSDFDVWTGNTGNTADNYASNWTSDAAPSPQEFDYPSFDSDYENGPDILDERIEYMLDNGFKGINGEDVLQAPDNYFVNNYWAEGDWSQYGHIKGAFRLFGEDLTLANDGFKHLNPEKTVVTYCWTGQTSSILTAYLTVLGYDATSLKFGANGMIYSDLQSHKWSESTPADFDYVQ